MTELETPAMTEEADEARVAPTGYEVPHVIAGKRVSSRSGRTADVFNPARGVAAGRVHLAGPEEIELAVAAAKSAFPAWADQPPLARARVMFRLLELMQARRESLARPEVVADAFTAEQRIRALTDAEDVAVVRELFDAYRPDWFIVGSRQGFRTAATLATGPDSMLTFIGRTPDVLIYQRTTP